MNIEPLNIFIGFLFCLIDAAIFLNVLSIFRNKKGSHLIDVSILLGISVVTFLVTEIGITPYVKIAIISAVMILSTFMYDLRLFQRILTVTLYYFIIILSELLVTFLTSNILRIPVEVLGENNYSYLFLGIISKFIAILIVSWVRKYFMSNRSEAPRKLNYIIISILFISTVSMILLFYSSLNLDYNTIQLFLFLITLFTLFTSLGLLLIYFYANTLYSELQKETTKRIYDESYRKFVLNAELKDEALSRMWHDIGNHIKVLEGLVDSKELATNKEYVNSLKEKFNSIPNHISSGNRLVDIILNDKYSEAVNRGIDVDIRAIVPPKLSIDDTDLSSIIFNTIDNGIEASANSPANERFIYIELYLEGNFLCYKIKNNYVANYSNFSEGDFGKKSHISRGYGLSIVRDIINKYNGYIDIKRRIREYSVTIVLPNTNKGL